MPLECDVRANMADCMKDMLLLTDFSGIGFPESAMSLLQHAWQDVSGLPSKVTCWRASDILAHCRS
eukprot:1078272-Alexandrium_andersonii.AAC.1